MRRRLPVRSVKTPETEPETRAAGSSSARRSSASPAGNETGPLPGTEISFDDLYPRYLNKVLSYVSVRVPNRADAEDITVDTFEAARASLKRYRGEGPPDAWLLAIARQRITLAARRSRSRREFEVLECELTRAEREMLHLLLSADVGQVPEDAAVAGEARHVIRGLLARLPEAQRLALLLRMDDGLPIREIARLLGRSPAAVNSLLQRARAAILRYGQEYFQG